MQTCILFYVIIMTLAAVVLAITGSVISSSALLKDLDDDSEMESARIILDSLSHWAKPFGTSIMVSEGFQECPDGFKDLFTKEWPGTHSGCFYNGRVMTITEYDRVKDKK